ncbi:hypothetical protein [Microbacterium sp. AR7-10]|jgi:GNAT superfamily N-acetyltransferase|uniref:hypothetical protein n=1 Tax=Microbacterium sp. AR7-10 TaxID=1891970 RepID=UPI0009F2403F|nr:hypothetical protein [Microbacterium sp. AR7-10]
MQTQMSFLIDSNVVITAEPFNGRLEELQPVVSTFLRIAGEHGHKVYVHPATLDDFKETSDSVHREQNIAAYAKYPALHEVAVPQHVLDVFPAPRSPNDDRDSRILAALDIGAVHFLVTNDSKLRKRAARLGHESRVLRPDDAAAQLETWHPGAPPPPPSVEALNTYELDASEPIFNSLRATYADFDGWIAKVKAESASRRAWMVRGADGRYEALAIVKMRDSHPVAVGKDAIKLSTFKVADFAAGRRLGELLLKAVLRWAANEYGRPSDMFVEVDASQDRLQEFLTDFGFIQVGVKDQNHPDEQVWLKTLDPPAGSDLEGLPHHIAYGPEAIRAGQPIFVIPIIPKWYEDLFPDAEVFGPSGAVPISGADPEPKAHGNAIKKAYLCRSPTNHIPPGSTLLFYRSQGGLKGDGAVVALGVAERSHKSQDPIETIELSFKRTVYSEEDVADLHNDGSAVLTILFRHDRFIVPPWPVDELRAHSVVTTWPQSVTRVKNPEGIAWVEQQLNAWP